MTSPFQQIADELTKLNLPIIPLRSKSKIPAINNWSKYSNELPTIEEVAEWKKIPNANIGLVLGESSGLIGLDLDHDKGGYHEKILALLDPLSSVVKKGQKGCTIFFKYNQEKTTRWIKDGEVVAELLVNGTHTVLPPSIHPCGKSYKYESLDDFTSYLKNIPPLPEGFIENVDKIIQPRNRQITQSKSKLNVNIDQVKKALTFISNREEGVDYETWLSIGMALKSDLGENAFSIWEEWSALSDKHDPTFMTTKWNSFRRSGYTLGTLFKLAIDNGFDFNDKVELSNIIKPLDVLNDLEDWRINGIDPGLSTGYNDLDNLIHFKKKDFIVWTGYPGSGKSEVLDSIALRLMNKDWKFLYVSLEKDPKSHIQSLVHKLSGKPIGERTRDEQRKCLKFLEDKCSMVGRNDLDPDIDNIVTIAKIYKNVFGLDAIVIDPYNYLKSIHKHSMVDNASYILERCTYMAQTLDIHVNLVAHPRKPDTAFKKSNNDAMSRITMYSISGSSDFANMADGIVAVYRDSDETEIDILKVRDQDIDSTGTCRLAFDKYSKRHKTIVELDL